MLVRCLPVRRALRPALALAAIAATLAITPGPAAGARPLHLGDHGRNVAGLQWILGGHRPSTYRTIRTFKQKPNGLYGVRTAHAVERMKWRLGFPTKTLNGTAGRDFVEILEGKRARPLGYLVRAGARTKATVPFPARERSSCVQKLIRIEKAELGTTEIPDGSNDGPRVHVYQSSTGAYRQAWCLSFQLYAIDKAGLGAQLLHSAGVYTETRWAKQHSLMHALPRAGAIVLFQDWGRPNGGHAGLVIKVTAHGFVSIEGNSHNRVREVYHLMGDRQPLFLWLPGCAT